MHPFADRLFAIGDTVISQFFRDGVDPRHHFHGYVGTLRDCREQFIGLRFQRPGEVVLGHRNLLGIFLIDNFQQPRGLERTRAVIAPR